MVVMMTQEAGRTSAKMVPGQQGPEPATWEADLGSWALGTLEGDTTVWWCPLVSQAASRITQLINHSQAM